MCKRYEPAGTQTIHAEASLKKKTHLSLELFFLKTVYQKTISQTGAAPRCLESLDIVSDKIVQDIP